MKKIVLEIIILILFALLIVWDQAYISPQNEFIEEKILEIGNGKPLPEKVFVSDGCSLWPDKLFGRSWGEYCIEHDIKYWLGGTKEDRLRADLTLKEEINSVFPLMGDIVYLGVRLGGDTLIPFPWNWGYGWDNSRATNNK